MARARITSAFYMDYTNLQVQTPIGIGVAFAGYPGPPRQFAMEFTVRR